MIAIPIVQCDIILGINQSGVIHVDSPLINWTYTVKYRVTRFKTLHIALKELEPFIRNGQHLQLGRPFESFGGMRSREALANWLICAAHNSTTVIDGQTATHADRLTFSSDPLGGDGIIWDTVAEEAWPTEHVMVPNIATREDLNVEQRILKAISHKNDKGGSAYARGKTLVVMVDFAGGPWFPNRVAKNLPDPFHFGAAWVVSLQGVEAGEYVYGVALLDMAYGNAPAWTIRIADEFDAWQVREI